MNVHEVLVLNICIIWLIDSILFVLVSDEAVAAFVEISRENLKELSLNNVRRVRIYLLFPNSPLSFSMNEQI